MTAKKNVPVMEGNKTWGDRTEGNPTKDGERSSSFTFFQKKMAEFWRKATKGCHYSKEGRKIKLSLRGGGGLYILFDEVGSRCLWGGSGFFQVRKKSSGRSSQICGGSCLLHQKGTKVSVWLSWTLLFAKKRRGFCVPLGQERLMQCASPSNREKKKSGDLVF